MFNVRRALQADTNKIKELGNKNFGDGYLDNWLLPDSIQKKNDNSICLVATQDANVIGIIYLLIAEKRSIKELTAFGLDASNLENATCNEKSSATFPSIFLSLIMVDEQYRRRGIATSLYTSVFQILSELNIKGMYATCWKESPGSAIVPFLEKQGWKEVSSKEKYWHEDSLKQGYQCARCGNPCFCTAVLMNCDQSTAIVNNC